MFLSPDDYMKQRNFAYADGIDDSYIWRFILRLFNRRSPDGDNENVYLNTDEIAGEFDITENALKVLLGFIEVESAGCLTVLPGKRYILFLKFLFIEFKGDYQIHFIKTHIKQLSKADTLVDAIFQVGKASGNTWHVETSVCCEKLGITTTEFLRRLNELKVQNLRI